MCTYGLLNFNTIILNFETKEVIYEIYETGKSFGTTTLNLGKGTVKQID